MRSNALLLAVSLFSTGSVLAGPCKPRGSSSDAPTTISSDAITTTLVPMDTTALSSDAESSTTVATTTTAPASLETFALIGAGGSVTNAEAQGSDEAGSLIVFNPTFNGLETRHYTLDTTTGRLQDAKSGNYVCAYYGGVYTTSVPPYVATCDPASTGPDRVYKYLDCRISGRKLSCRTPSTALCYYDGDSREYICMSEPQNEPYHEFFYQNGGDSDYWYISNGSPDGYTAMDILVSST
ncbi:hypothetical protein HG530_010765 [Fusarium avenaceum]|nr:hypothetical protein HG530_010765 [Fusarium avenaceum]